MSEKENEPDSLKDGRDASSESDTADGMDGDDRSDKGTETDESTDSTAPSRGRVRIQDPKTAAPREPTVAEQRAREHAEQRKTEQEREAVAEAARKTRPRRRVLIGGGATVGVVALVAAFYTAAQPEEYTATCTVKQGNQDVVVEEKYCSEQYAQSHGGHYNPVGGFWFIPLGMPGGGGQYRYNYTPAGAPTGSVGQSVPSGGSFTKPDSGEVKTKSGSTVQRGGFGIGNKSGGFGGKSGS